MKKSNNEWLTARKANLKQLKKKLEVADVSIKENEESSEKLLKELAALMAKAGAAQQEETCLRKKLAEEKTIVAHLQQLNTDAESHRTDLTKKITTLECESKNLKIKINSLQNEVGDVEKETISVKEVRYALLIMPSSLCHFHSNMETITHWIGHSRKDLCIRNNTLRKTTKTVLIDPG